jgi:hypothetical protein
MTTLVKQLIRSDSLKTLSVHSVLVVLLMTGCHKATPQAAPVPAPASDAAATNASDPASPPPPVPTPSVASRSENNLQQNASGEVNGFLTQQLGIFIQQKGRLPVNFAEFARARLDGVPRPPAGMKWVIDGATRQVKAVPSQ